MSRPIIYDVTPLARIRVEDVGGIDRVAFAYGRHFDTTSRPNVSAAYFGARSPHLLNAEELSEILAATERAWRDDVAADADPEFTRILAWLGGIRSGASVASGSVPPPHHVRRIALHARHWISSALRPLPERAIYLNVFNAGREHHFLFDWLERRDVTPVFFVHDLLPLDHPEYFRRGHLELSRRRLATICREGAAYIVSTAVVRDRLLEVIRPRRRSEPRIHIAPLPSPLLAPQSTPIAEAPYTPYFLVIGTIEPRKNHLLLLDAWQEMASLGGPVPKLIAVGGPGWENQDALAMFERSALRPHVRKVQRLSRAALARLLAGARALLMPSFDEGYGLPIVDALTMGTPVIASDIPVFRETTQGSAALLSPLDGRAWRDAILSLADQASSAWSAAQAKARQFNAPTWHDYFRGVEDFLDSL